MSTVTKPETGNRFPTLWRHNSAAVRPINAKFGWQMQNDMSMTTAKSIWKSEVKFQYGGCLFLKAEVVISLPSIETFDRNLV